LASDQPVEQFRTLSDLRAEVLAPSRLSALVVGGFAAVALTIAIVGVAAVLVSSVGRRTRELGIRLAIGSQPRTVLAGVLGEGLRIVGLGIALGVAGALGLSRVASSVVPDLKAVDPLSMLAAAVTLGAAAVMASAVPAWRAARLDVVQALRE
jgi:ABC-type antimicrobial peptide transport system permease subunit